MQDKFILKSVADTFTGKPVYQITIPVRVPKEVEQPKRTLLGRILRKKPDQVKEPETSRAFEIKPCVVGNMYRVSGHAGLLPDDIFEHQSNNIKLITEHLPTITYIVASAIQNNHLEPDPELIKFLEDNVDAIDLYDLLKASFSSLRMDSFTNSIVLMKGTVGILNPETSPKEGRELIASHTAQ